VDYGRVFSSELTPNFLNYVALINCISPIPLESGFNYCDLGCGNGVTPTVLAAANPRGKFYGIDFNPIHIEKAQELAGAGKVENVTFLQKSFAELEDLSSLPEFHFIAVHAVYAWISPENRQHLLNFIRRHLVPGGLVYLDYNCLPGMALLAPINKIMREYALAQPQPPLEQVKAAVLFGEQLLGADSAYVQSSPFLSSQISGFKERPLNALAHEFLNENWTPSYSIDVARHLATAELSYVGSSIIVENYDELILTEPSRRLLNSMPAGEMRQLCKDFLRNQSFRRDVYVKQGQRLSDEELLSHLEAMLFGLARPSEILPATVKLPLGEVSLTGKETHAILAALKEKPQTLAQLAALPELSTAGRLAAAAKVQLLVACQQVLPFTGAGDEAATRRLNQAIAARSLEANQLEVLASPVAGTGIYVHPSVLLVLHLLEVGSWENLPELIWEEYQKHGISLNVGGKQVIQGKTEAIATLRQELESFIPRHRYYLEYFRFTDSSFFESEEKPLTSVPP
jgi:SAM-dependent methyltransferase